MGWLLTGLCTASGHFLSLHKANVKEPVPIFVYLGYEFDCPKLEIRLPEKRKLKMRTLLGSMLNQKVVPFHDLEKFRGMAIRYDLAFQFIIKFVFSLSFICPLALLYIREMTRLLVSASEQLVPDIELDDEIRAELKSWDDETFLINSVRQFGQIQEKDVVMTSMIDYRPFQAGDPEMMSGIFIFWRE